MIVKPNPQHLTSTQLDKVDNAVTSEPTSGQYKIKKVVLKSGQADIKVTHSSAAEP